MGTSRPACIIMLGIKIIKTVIVNETKTSYRLHYFLMQVTKHLWNIVSQFLLQVRLKYNTSLQVKWKVVVKYLKTAKLPWISLRNVQKNIENETKTRKTAASFKEKNTILALHTSFCSSFISVCYLTCNNFLYIFTKLSPKRLILSDHR